jgi:hypothetical protein
MDDISDEKALIVWIEEAFKFAFGDEILDVVSRPMLPYEAFVEVRVKRDKAGMNDLAGTLEEELDELGRKVSIRIMISSA